MTDSAEKIRFEEQRLVRETQQGNSQAFARLYDSYAQRIHDFIYHKTFQRETTRDLTQTVFLKAIEGIDRLDDRTGSFCAWLFAIARNTVVDHYRTRHPSLALEDVWDLAADHDVPLDAQNRERYEILHDCLHQLKAEQRELLILRIWQDLPFAEIARLQGISEGSCKMAFHRLIKQLRRQMPQLLMWLLIFKP